MKFGTLHQILNPVTVTWPKIAIFKIQDDGGRHLENRFFGHKSSNDFPITAKFCTRKQYDRSTRARGQKMQIFRIQHGERPPLWISWNRYISVKSCPILMKFGTLHHIILNLVTVTWPKIEIFKIQDGCGRHLENRIFGHKSSTDCVRKQNGMLTRYTKQKNANV